ncbi:MAG TPA: hypothetical protein VGG28_15765 [Kofleriaceae bacterium]|jgi:hypothetical protein
MSRTTRDKLPTEQRPRLERDVALQDRRPTIELDPRRVREPAPLPKR